MFNFNSAFKDSLEIATERFKQADMDLHRVVGAVSVALNSATDEALELRLVDRELGNALLYRVSLAHRGDCFFGDERVMAITSFRVTARGFPIEAGRYNDHQFKPERELKNVEELSAYFAEMASSSDSLLVCRAATLMALHERRIKAMEVHFSKPDETDKSLEEPEEELSVPF